MTSKMVPIGDILGRTLEKFRPSADTGMTAIWDLWDGVTGPVLSENAKPAAFKNGTLIVNVSSSAWLHQLGFMKKELVDRLNHALGDSLVKEVRFKIARLHH